ncbi:Putative disease resistance protein RGA3 [Linum perenne]
MAAETILLPVAKQILGKLGKLATEQIGLIWTLKREVLKLKATLSTIQAVLLDAEEKQTHNRHVKDWLEKLSDVMYDADDLLDDFSSEACRQAMAEADDIPKQLIHGLKVAHDIKAIREKLNDIAKDKDNLHLEVRSDEAALPLALALRESSSCPPITVVGREDDKNSIVKLLLNSNSEANISVVPIVGMGGLGKTTLAQLVFDDKRVQDYFVISFWVYVSQIFNIKVILGKMLQSITCKREADLDLVQLQGKLHKELTGNRFLFALDDVWEENDQSWETLANYLAVGAPGSKVLVTTRSAKVAEVCGRIIKSERSTTIVEPYLLKGLSLDESWDLLVRKAHPRQVPQDPHLKKVGQEILGRCCGVPLAVSTIAGVLISSKHPEIEWPSFLQKRLLDTSNDAVPIMTTLQLSFNHLPSKLKRCFAYCKLYPKGHKFNVQRLVHLCLSFLFGGMEGIPDSIINLLNLRVLGVISTSLTELPRDIRKLVNLKHLYFESGNLTHMPKGIGELKWLQTLPFFVVGKKSSSNEEMLGAGLDELKELNALRGQLVITNLLHGKYTAATTTCSSSSMQAALVTPLSKLTCLVLRDIDDLESLPEDGLRNLTSLQELDIRNCPRLASLPPAMRQLTSIQSLKLVNCPQLNDRFENREGEDWLNISHIPNIFVDELELAMEDGHFDDYFCPCCGSSIRRKVVLRRRRRMIEELMFF